MVQSSLTGSKHQPEVTHSKQEKLQNCHIRGLWGGLGRELSADILPESIRPGVGVDDS